MGELGTFDPGQMVNIFGGAVVSGFADGDAITFERDSENYVDMAGLDGGVGRMRLTDKRGTITYTLLQTSKMNDIFSTIFNVESLTNDISVAVPWLFKDNSGRTVAGAAKTWIQKVPGVTINAQGLTTRVWVLRCAELQVFIGGNDE